MLQPKRTKYRKAFKGRIKGAAKGGTELKREAFNLRFQAATNQLERPARVQEVRRTIARIKTLQSERTRAAAAKA